MTEKEYAPARQPTAEERGIRETFLRAGSVEKAAYDLGVSRSEVILALAVNRWFAQDVFNNRYEEAIRIGMPQVDAREAAEQEVAFRTQRIADDVER